MRHFPEEDAPDRAAATVAFTEALRRLSYPTTKGAAVREVGDLEVPITDTTGAHIADLILGLPESALHDYSTAAKALDQRWARVARTLAEVEAAERRRER